MNPPEDLDGWVASNLEFVTDLLASLRTVNLRHVTKLKINNFLLQKLSGAPRDKDKRTNIFLDINIFVLYLSMGYTHYTTIAGGISNGLNQCCGFGSKANWIRIQQHCGSGSVFRIRTRINTDKTGKIRGKRWK